MKAKTDKGVWFKGRFCEVWGGLYAGNTIAFFRGALPGLSRTITSDDSACVVVEEETVKEIYGLSRSRDEKGKVVSRSVNDYINCIHASVAGGYENMWVLVLEVYEDTNNSTGGRQG